MAGQNKDNYLKMRHPRLYKKMQKGGKVEYYEKGGKTTDTVPAMLTPGEVVLNAQQQSALGKLMGADSAEIFAKIGVPGFAKGGSVGKKDLLMAYYMGGKVKKKKRGY